MHAFKNFLILLCLPSLALAHSGRQDSNGGHVDRVTGSYHCHSADCVLPNITSSNEDILDIVSFNIQFLGNFKNKDDEAIAAFVAPYDIVVIQELVAPPYSGTFPNGQPFKPDPEAKEFFEAMSAHGFDYVLSEEDTGTNDINHINSTATEWWVTFYKPQIVESIQDIPHGYLAEDRTNHPDYERVPYAVGFRTLKGGNDFVLISVHLKPGDSSKDAARRNHELKTVANWVNSNSGQEKNFFILGDMNFKNCDEIESAIPSGFKALNSGDSCLMTNTNINSPRPYDNVLYLEETEPALYFSGQFQVLSLIDAMQVAWFEDFSLPYPGNDPYNHNTFRTRYSDHHPVRFRLKIEKDND